MNGSLITLTQAAGDSAATSNPTAAWDLVSFLANAQTYAGTVGAGLISLLGLILLIWAVVRLSQKFFGGQSAQQHSWGMIIIMLIVGGALLSGGIVFIRNISSGGQRTIEDLGGGFLLLQSALPGILG